MNETHRLQNGIKNILKHERDALHALTFQRLMTKDWSEYLQSHVKIESQIPESKK